MAPSMDVDRLEELLQQCVVRIPGRGTGFFVAPGQILTCSHLFDFNPVDSVEFVGKPYGGSASVTRLRTKDTPALPDLALLNVKEWTSGDPENHPCVILTLESDPPRGCCAHDDRFFVFGHPEGDFELNGEGQLFQFGALNQNNDNTWTIALTGNWTRRGFSGSPVLNLRTGQVIGVLAIKVGHEAVAVARAISSDAAIQGFPSLRAFQERIRDQDTRWARLLPGARIWEEASQSCEARIKATTKEHKEAGDEYYVSRGIERDFERFLESDKSAMVIVGQSGMGETILLARLSRESQEKGQLAWILESGTLPEKLSDLRDSIARDLHTSRVPPIEFWDLLEAECNRRSKYLILFVDAVNEYSAGGQPPLVLLTRLDAGIWNVYSNKRHIKFVITCRPETWTRGMELARVTFEQHAEAYFRSGGEIAHHLLRFSAEESEQAYEKYRTVYRVTTPYSELEGITKYLFEDPLLLYIAFEVYASDGKIPTDLGTGELFDKYLDMLEFQDTIWGMVGQMFVREGTSIESEVVQHDWIKRDTGLGNINKTLYDNLDTSVQSKPGFRLKDRNVLREWKVDGVTHLRFSYDRFAEYLLAKAIGKKIDARITKREAPESAAVDVVKSNLINSQQMNTVQGALQQLLIQLLREHPQDYATVLEEIARIDTRGMSLVISVMARTARTSGIAVLGSLLDRLTRNNSRLRFTVHRVRFRIGALVATFLSKAKSPVTWSGPQPFPIIHAVYRVLRNQEYRLWLHGLKNEIDRDAHLKVLYKYFHWGFQHKDEVVSAAAIQYLFFLWRARENLDNTVPLTPCSGGLLPPPSHGNLQDAGIPALSTGGSIQPLSCDYLRDAVAITSTIVNSVQPLSIPFLLNMVRDDGQCGCRAQKRQFGNLSLLFFLVLGDIREKQVAGLAKDVGRILIQRLKLEEAGTLRAGMLKLLRFVLSWRLLNSYLHFFRAQPNPVELKALYAFFSNYDQEEGRLATVLDFLETKTVPSLARLREIAQTENGIILEMLTFALSVWYESSRDDKERFQRLQLVGSLFFGEPQFPKAEYCASLALYHINYFGKHATKESMVLMGQMADHILIARKGVFDLAGKTRNFNIVGTYGRALRRNGALLKTANQQRESTHALQYAINALTSAKMGSPPENKPSPGHYKYICDNIGLLGILIEPSQVFDVIASIHNDFFAPSPDSTERPFSAKDVEEIKRIVIQSLANIRTLYPTEVDKFLLERLESPELYATVANTAPRFDMAVFMSWEFEQMMFRILTDYYENFGTHVVKAIREGIHRGSARSSVQVVLGRVIDRLSEIAQ